MKESEVRSRAFAMPLTSPAFPMGPYRFCRSRISDHHLSHRSGKAARTGARAAARSTSRWSNSSSSACPIRPASATTPRADRSFRSSFQGRKGGYTHCMFLDDHPPIAGGRELWGFPKKLAKPTLRAEIDTLVGTLDYGPRAHRHRHHGLQAQGGRPRRGQGVAGWRPISCSRSSRMSTARRASASSSNIILRTST